jgi:phenylacetate-CoA ligase
LDRIRGNDRLSNTEQIRLQREKLYSTLQIALRKYPFYRNISPDFSPEDAERVLRDQFPIIDKSELLNNPSGLYPNGGRVRPWSLAGKSSGTTGTPVVVYRSLESAAMEQAFIRRHWEWSGFSGAATRVTLRGDMIVPLEADHPPFWYWNRFDRQLIVSSRHLREPFAESIVAEIRNLQPFALQAYPSTAYSLAKILEDRDQMLAIPYLFSASEPLYGHQIDLIKRRMGSTIMDMYGMAERVAFATGCELGGMHLNTDYSFVEIVDEQGNPTTDEGFVVGTTFHNDVMPLVRYRMSDRTRLMPDECACGRTFPLIAPVTGKYEDALFNKNGNQVSPSVLTFAFKGVENIAKSQVAQVAEGAWQIRIVPMSGYTKSDEERLIKNIRRLVDTAVELEVVLKESIPNTSAGKFRWVVNETSR